VQFSNGGIDDTASKASDFLDIQSNNRSSVSTNRPFVQQAQQQHSPPVNNLGRQPSSNQLPQYDQYEMQHQYNSQYGQQQQIDPGFQGGYSYMGQNDGPVGICMMQRGNSLVMQNDYMMNQSQYIPIQPPAIPQPMMQPSLVPAVQPQRIQHQPFVAPMIQSPPVMGYNAMGQPAYYDPRMSTNSMSFYQQPAPADVSAHSFK
jgi:hypothetical protein